MFLSALVKTTIRKGALMKGGNTILRQLIENDEILTDSLDIALAKKLLEEGISTFSERYLEIINYRLGLEDDIPHTLEDTADHFHIDPKIIKGLERRAFKPLTKHRMHIRFAKGRKRYFNDSDT